MGSFQEGCQPKALKPTRFALLPGSSGYLEYQKVLCTKYSLLNIFKNENKKIETDYPFPAPIATIYVYVWSGM